MSDKHSSFTEFLRRCRNSDEVPPILTHGIMHNEFPGTEDTSNLFAVSQHFMKVAKDDPELILRALVAAYHRWILANMRETAKSLERCIAANRVVFIEDSHGKKNEVDIWHDLNQTLTDLTGNIQDFGVISNYALLQYAVHEEPK